MGVKALRKMHQDFDISDDTSPDFFRNCEDILAGTEDFWDDFFESSEVEEWLGGAPWQLHCSGPPRSGKTTFTAAIARLLQQNAQTSRETVAIVALYFSTRNIQYLFAGILGPLEVILRAVLRQLTNHRLIYSEKKHKASENSIGSNCARLSSTLERVKQLIKERVHRFDKVYVLIDGVHDICNITETELGAELRSLKIPFVLFVGVPLNRLSADWGCDARHCGKESRLWAECESCNLRHCPSCYDAEFKCCSDMGAPVPIVEVRLSIKKGDITRYVKKNLPATFEDDQIRDDIVSNIMEESKGSFALAKLSVDALNENPAFEDIPQERDRLPLDYIRYFNFALCRVKHQRSESDALLGLRVLALVSLAGDYPLTFNALKGALICQPDAQRFGRLLSRARLSHVSQGWLTMKDQWAAGCATETALFNLQGHQARTYLYEECPELYEENLAEGRDFALLCLNTLIRSQHIFQKLDGDPHTALSRLPEGHFLKYALENWAHHYKKFSSPETRAAAYEFLGQYQNGFQLQHLRLKTWTINKQSVSDKMHFIAAFGLDELIDKYIEEGIGHDVLDAVTAQTPAMVACGAGHELFVKKLIKKGINLAHRCKADHSALCLAVHNARTDVICCILGEADSNIVNSQNRQGQTILMRAVKLHNENPGKYKGILKILLESNKLELDRTDNQGKTAFHHAAGNINRECLELMLKRKDIKRVLNVPEQNSLGRTAMMSALMPQPSIDPDERWQVLELMIRAGASIDAKDSRGRTLLHYAVVDDDNASVVEGLLKYNIDVDAKDNRGWSPLHAASAHSSLEAVRVLLAGGADPSSENPDGKTPLSLSSSSSVVEMTELMKVATLDGKEAAQIPLPAASETGTDQQATNFPVFSFFTDLQCAVRAAALERVKQLLSDDIDINAATINGDTALHLAIQSMENAYELCPDEEYEEFNALRQITDLLLVHRDIDPNIENDWQQNPFDLAMRLTTRHNDLILDIFEAMTEFPGYVPRTIPDIDKLIQCALKDSGRKPPRPALIRALYDAGANVFQPLEPTDLKGKLAKEIAREERLREEVLAVIDDEEESILGALRVAQTGAIGVALSCDTAVML